MQPQNHITPVLAEDYARVVDVWEAAVRQTHHFLTETDIEFFKPLVREELPHTPSLFCVRDPEHQVTGFVGVAGDKVEMLFIHPGYRGQGQGRRLLEYAIHQLGARVVDVNEQNEQAVGFYLRLGFFVERRSAVDSLGKPFPLLHLRIRPQESQEPSSNDAV